MKFKYRENYYWLRSDGKYRIRSCSNTDGAGYSWYFVNDEEVIKILDEFVRGLEG